MEDYYYSMYGVYAIVFIFSVFFAFLSQPKISLEGSCEMNRTKIFCFILSLLIPWVVISFTRIGVDYDNYYKIIGRLDWDNLKDQGDSEYGFNLVAMAIMSILGGNIDGAIFILKTITILTVYICIFWMKDRVNIGYSVMFYLLMMYIPSFYLISQCLAASIIMLAMVYYLRGGKTSVTIVVLLLAGMIHNSIFIFIPYFLLCVFSKKSKMQVWWVLLVVVISILFASVFFRYAQTLEGFHYNNYMLEERQGSGLLLYVMSAFMMFIVYQMYKRDNNIDSKTMLLYFSAAICIFKILGNYFIAITRMEYNFMIVYVILIPAYIKYHKANKFNMELVYLILAFMLFNGYRTVTGRISSPFSMMNYYIPFNPF